MLRPDPLNSKRYNPNFYIALTNGDDTFILKKKKKIVQILTFQQRYSADVRQNKNSNNSICFWERLVLEISYRSSLQISVKQQIFCAASTETISTASTKQNRNQNLKNLQVFLQLIFINLRSIKNFTKKNKITSIGPLTNDIIGLGRSPMPNQ